MNVCSSVYVMIRAIAVPATENPLLAALLEGTFAFEAYRGAIFCLIVLTNCKSGIGSIVRQTEELIVTFSLTATNVRTIRRFMAAFVALTVLSITVLSSLQSARMILHTFVNIEPFFVAPSVVMAPLFALFSVIPELLSRIVVVLVAGSGMVLLSCLKVMRQTFFDAKLDISDRVHTALYQYYALASSLATISKHLGGVLAFFILSDLLPLCGRMTRLFFSLESTSLEEIVTRKVADAKGGFYIIMGISFYILAMYGPFIKLHKQVIIQQLYRTPEA
ncbi:hypothetical protein BV898_18564 [Hypsibius exemplaris]|uniref:Uncharacterized protein n=1 Tax=Hypsibius exemplaris TaxID=2072580 RepID=A0A9X6NJI1_HYPEX|nr:hypothetical protein BV898_18564 [Hypsibius exemplaris]